MPYLCGVSTRIPSTCVYNLSLLDRFKDNVFNCYRYSIFEIFTCVQEDTWLELIIGHWDEKGIDEGGVLPDGVVQELHVFELVP